MDTLARLEELLQRSWAAEREGRHAEGAELAEDALKLGDDGRAWASLALHRLRLGDLRASMAAGQRALPLLEGPEHSAALTRVAGTLCVACLQADMVQQALGYAQRATQAAELTGDGSARAWALIRTAQVHRMLGKAESSTHLFKQALEEGEQAHDLSAQFSALHNQAWFTVEELLQAQTLPASRLAEALGLLEQAHALAEREGNAHSLGINFLNRSRLHQALDHVDESRRLASAALSMGQQHGLTQLVVGAQAVLAQALLREGDAGSALTLLQGVQGSLSADDLISRIDMLGLIVKALRALGRLEEALDTFGELHTLSLRQAKSRADIRAWMAIHQYEVEHERDRAARAELEASVERLRATQWEVEAQHDALTGLPNRRFLGNRMPELLAHAQRVGQPLWAAVLDLDFFKRINDQFGHDVGDQVLRELGSLLRQHLRTRDLPVRLGGEEFLVLIPDATAEQAQAMCERLRARIEAHDWERFATGLRATASFGLTQVTQQEGSWQAADAALYVAKAQGRNRVVVG